MYLPAGLRGLRHRDYRLYFAGQAISLCGSWMQTVGQSWLVLALTDSPFRVSLIPALQFLPMLLGSLVTGTLADRWPKRTLLLATQAGQAVTAFALALLASTGRAEYWHVAVLALLLG